MYMYVHIMCVCRLDFCFLYHELTCDLENHMQNFRPVTSVELLIGKNETFAEVLG